MVRPEVRAVESKRATRERNTRQVVHLRRFLLRIESRDAPIFVRLLRPAQEVDQSIDERMAADLRTDINRAQNVSGHIDIEKAMLSPLTQVKMITVEPDISTAKLRARDPIFSEPARRLVA